MKIMLEKFNLNGKTALITGAAGLLGVEHSAALLECGARVVMTDISQTNLDSALEILSKSFNVNSIRTQILDVSNLESITCVEKLLIDADIRIDILLNNAAIDPKVRHGKNTIEGSRLECFSLEQWNLQLAVGLTGAFLCSQVFGGAMARDGLGGVILNIASDLSILSPDQRLYKQDGLQDNLQPVKPVTYSVIKAGLIGLTRYLATYWAENGIRCNALSPGGVFNGQSDEFVRRLSSRIPMGRMASVDEYRAAIQFLCSDASSYMNGQNVVMDGGRSVW